MDSLLGLLLILGAVGWFWNRKKIKNNKYESKSQSDFSIDSSVRNNFENNLRENGIIGGSALQESHGYENAYKRIMSNVVADDSIKSELYSALCTHNHENIAEQYLLPNKWNWPEFDKWRSIFLSDGKFPYMWKKYPEICVVDFNFLPMVTIFERLKIKDIKTLLKSSNIEISDNLKKTDLVNIAAKNINCAKLKEFAPEMYSRLKQEFEERVNKGKCRILEHTIYMLGYSLRDYYTNNKLKLDLGISCPVEKKYAKGHGQITEYNIPPFFPGDRTGVTFKQKKHF